MVNLYHKILNEDISIKKNTIWYTLGSLCSSASNVLLLLYVTRILGADEAGVYSIAYSVAQLMLSIGWYGTRQFQVSDISEKYSFDDYLGLKIITSLLAIIGGIIYAIFLKSDFHKFMVIFLFCVFIVCDIYADLFSSRFQQKDMLHIAGKSYMIRIIGYNLIFFISLIFFHSLTISIFLSTIYSILELLVFDYPMIKAISAVTYSFDKRKILMLFRDCFPLFISSFLTIFMVNIPKNAIDMSFSNDIQTYYNVIFMPSSVVNLFTMFIFVPQFTIIAQSWNDKNKRFFNIVFKLFVMLLILSCFILIVGYYFGIPILNIVYAVHLDQFKDAFLVLLLAGCICSFNYILSYIITVMRKQKCIVYIYFITLVVSQVIIDYLIDNFYVLGAAIDYLLSMGLTSILFILFIIFYTRNETDF